MVHLGAMPGTPFYEEGSYEATFDKALGDATALFEGGATGCLVQTVDRVYTTKDESDPARIAGVANIVRAIAQASGGLGAWPLDTQDSLYILKAVFAAYRSAESGKSEMVR